MIRQATQGLLNVFPPAPAAVWNEGCAISEDVVNGISARSARLVDFYVPHDRPYHRIYFSHLALAGQAGEFNWHFKLLFYDTGDKDVGIEVPLERQNYWDGAEPAKSFRTGFADVSLSTAVPGALRLSVHSPVPGTIWTRTMVPVKIFAIASRTILICSAERDYKILYAYLGILSSPMPF